MADNWAVVAESGERITIRLRASAKEPPWPQPSSTAQLSAMAQGGGYVLASGGPLLAGLLRGWTGSFQSSALLLVTLALAMAWCGWGAGRRLLVKPRLSA